VEDSLTDVEPAAPSYAQPSYSSSQSSYTDSFRGTVSDAGEKVSEFASDTTEKVSNFAGAAADKAGDYAERAVDKAGDYAERAASATSRVAGEVVDRLRNNAELAAERGTTTIGDEVVEKIAGFAARQVEGIYDLGGDLARALASVKEKVGLGEKDEQSDRGVTVRLEGNTATVKIVIVIEYGYVVYTVAEQVRGKVIDAVERLLSLDVTAVDVVVDDVHIDESKLAGTVKG
jgi:uncharacterized alkaline shock family protein YloU